MINMFNYYLCNYVIMYCAILIKIPQETFTNGDSLQGDVLLSGKIQRESMHGSGPW